MTVADVLALCPVSRAPLRRVLAAAFVLLSGVSPAAAYRPFVTEDAGVAGSGVLQGEASWDSLKWRNGDVDQIVTLVGPIYGVTERVELSAEIPFVIHDVKGGPTTAGVGDVNLVGKVLAIEETDLVPTLTTKAVIKLETGDYDRGLGSGDEDYSLVLAGSKAIGPVQVHAQVGYTWTGKDEDGDDLMRDIWLYGVAGDLELLDGVHAVAEFAGNQHTTIGEPHQENVLAGFIYRLSDSLALDATLRRGVTHSSLDWAGGIGVSIDILK